MGKKLWAIADLHLGFSTGKWMNKFGDHWTDHHLKVRANWLEKIEDDDLVLLPGDFSWAMKLQEVAVDFEWLGELPGKKILIKGNHDYWWPKTKAKMRSVLPPDVYALKKNALIVDGVPFVGVRGCDFAPYNKEDSAQTEAELEKELREFKLSIENLATLGPLDRPPVALFHYPPFPPGSCDSPFVRLAEEAGCELAVYGHLHTQAEWERFFQGEFRGVTYHLVACDFLDFDPVLLCEL